MTDRIDDLIRRLREDAPRPLKYTIDLTTGCWNVLNRKIGKYVQVHRNRKLIFAHRLSYQVHFGAIPEGLCVCHRCDNRICINPEHLFLGTINDNNQDMVSKKRHSFGNKNGRAKISEQQVKEIREKFNGFNSRTLAKIYGLGREETRKIGKRLSWRHI